MTMTTRTRIATTIIAASALAATHYGQAMNVMEFGRTGKLWHWGAVAAFGFALRSVALVNRWWALFPAAMPGAVTFYLYRLTDYSTPWDSESIGSPSQPVLYVVLLLLGSGFYAAVLSIGFLPRLAWDAARRRLSRRSRVPSLRG
ncbi:MAG: hypothetical protein JST59_12015 [Actinobacteria bacterium]|nr:hypothetical protein [Actinomycetota bacterium]